MTAVALAEITATGSPGASFAESAATDQLLKAGRTPGSGTVERKDEI